MNPRLLILGLASLLMAGCDNSSEQKTSQGDKLSDAADVTAKAAKTEKRSSLTADMSAMNKAVLKFYVQEGRFPKALDELVEKQYVPILPLLPENAAWDYDTNSGVVSIQKN